jgi:hypothetical protein
LHVLGQRFGVVDAYQHGPCGDILATLHRYFLDPPVHARRNIKARRIDLTLNEQRDRSQQIVC